MFPNYQQQVIIHLSHSYTQASNHKHKHTHTHILPRKLTSQWVAGLACFPVLARSFTQTYITHSHPLIVEPWCQCAEADVHLTVLTPRHTPCADPPLPSVCPALSYLRISVALKPSFCDGTLPLCPIFIQPSGHWEAFPKLPPKWATYLSIYMEVCISFLSEAQLKFLDLAMNKALPWDKAKSILLTNDWRQEWSWLSF